MDSKYPNIVRTTILGLFAAISTFVFSSSAFANPISCPQTGKIISVSQGVSELSNRADVSIEVKSSDGTITVFTTTNEMNVNNNTEARSLLQIALMAYASKADVRAFAAGDCDKGNVGDFTNAVDKWVGLRIRSES